MIRYKQKLTLQRMEEYIDFKNTTKIINIKTEKKNKQYDRKIQN